MAVRVKGLDDSATSEKVKAAICRVGNYSSESVLVGEIRWGYGAIGAVIARCPADVAKAVLGGGCLLVGWSSAGVELLEERPMRYYRCQEPGHTRAACPTEVDRSEVCFRCGVVGHCRNNCTGVLRCAVCVDLGLPAGHELGSRSCKAPRKKGKTAGFTPAAPSRGRVQAQVEAMSS